MCLCPPKNIFCLVLCPYLKEHERLLPQQKVFRRVGRECDGSTVIQLSWRIGYPAGDTGGIPALGNLGIVHIPPDTSMNSAMENRRLFWWSTNLICMEGKIYGFSKVHWLARVTALLTPKHCVSPPPRHFY